MTSDREMLAAIHATPDDDPLRLAYAAHIAAAEPDYAAFIGLQIARIADERNRGVVVSRPSAQATMLLRAHLVEWGGREPIRALFDDPHLAHLDSLSLRGANMTDDDAEAFARSPHIARLTWLDLREPRRCRRLRGAGGGHSTTSGHS